MKKTVLMFALAFSAVIGNAQSFKKSDKFVEGTVSYSKSTGTDAEYSVSPTVGYWVSDRFAAGVFAEIAKSASETTGFGAFGRCQFATVAKNIRVFSQLSLSTSTDKTAGVSTSTFNTNLGLGAYYFVNGRLALTMNVADLASYTSVGSNSTFTLGFAGVNNPLSAASFGVSYRF